MNFFFFVSLYLWWYKKDCMKKKKLFKLLLLLTLLSGLPSFAGVHYSFIVGTGVGPYTMMMDPFMYGGFYSPYYMYNRPYYRNYLYYGGGANFAPPPPPVPMPVIRHKRPDIRLHRIHKIPR